MELKYKFEHSLDSIERTMQHRDIIMRKKFLRKLYEQWYGEFISEMETIPNGKFVEIGSGGGFLKELAPNVICTDVLDLQSNDMTFSALEMPFDDNSVDAIFMVNTLHHIPEMEIFLNQINRVLVKNGKLIMIEPVNSIWGRFIYKNFHHELFDVEGDWSFPDTGPLSGANGALPWIVFERDIQIFNKKYPDLNLESIQYRNAILYLASGGVSYRQLLPDFMYGLVSFIDEFLPKMYKQLSLFQKIKVTKV